MQTWCKAFWKERLRPLLSRLKYRVGGPFRTLQRTAVNPIGWFYGGPSSAICYLHNLYPLTPERVIAGYAQGIFATGERNDTIVWHCPGIRAVIPTDQVHISKRLKGYLRKNRFEIRFDQEFDNVMRLCADREKTWITSQVMGVNAQLYEMGFAHSVEAYLDNRLVGGGYGVALGNVFFLESMFCHEDHASKIAFVSLAEKLRQDGFVMIDCQFMTEHWRRFGAQKMPHDEFQRMVVRELSQPARFSNQPPATPMVSMPLSAVETLARH